jgi:hypothetical protein
MKKYKNLGVLFLSGLAFIGLFYFVGEGNFNIPVNEPTSPIYDELNKNIGEFGMNIYEDLVYSKLKQECIGAKEADEISSEEQSRLMLQLELAKSEALIRSFDAIKNTNCLGSVKLTEITNLLRKQQKIKSLDEAKKRIDIYQNIRRLSSLGGKVNGFLRQQYTNTRARDLRNEIALVCGLPGVNICTEVRNLKDNWLSKLDRFADIDADYMKIRNNVKLFLDTPNHCELYAKFGPYPFYTKELKNMSFICQ